MIGSVNLGWPLFGLKLVSQQSTVVLEREIITLTTYPKATAFVRYFFGDNAYSGQRLASLHFEAQDGTESGIYFAEAFLNLSQVEALFEACRSISSTIGHRPSDVTKQLNKNALGAIGAFKLYLALVLAKPINVYQVTPEFGAKTITIKLYHLPKHGGCFVEIKIKSSGFSPSVLFSVELFERFDWIVRNLQMNMR
ncbi:hypothetical protein MicloDRAFT_00038780 [Microvirga lotononidis]|uniref:Uncharacterized protein n=2 Tax=Microvirga lotononidis TaxID=864069 RepID=I4YTM7_9HYPH|nr:hypothetical protein MicloDRAFT_00038780 [Microvirga lotononidis]